MSLPTERTEGYRSPEQPRRAEATRLTPLREGPLLVEGPVEIVMPDGTVERCDRPVVALCMCRRSLRSPFCDTSHRPRLRRERREKEKGEEGEKGKKEEKDEKAEERAPE
jgi:CDGSH-type Zn-finger protein